MVIDVHCITIHCIIAYVSAFCNIASMHLIINADSDIVVKADCDLVLHSWRDTTCLKFF